LLLAYLGHVAVAVAVVLAVSTPAFSPPIVPQTYGAAPNGPLNRAQAFPNTSTRSRSLF